MYKMHKTKNFKHENNTILRDSKEDSLVNVPEKLLGLFPATGCM